MTRLDAIEVLATGERLTIPIPLPPPVVRGSVTVALATAPGGSAVHPTMHRTLAWHRGGVIPPLVLFTKDVRALWPRGGPCWLVVRYAGTVIATGQVRVVV